MSRNYIFVLGNAETLALAELTNILNRSSVKFLQTTLEQSVILVDSSHELDAVDLMSKLGGTVKIAQVLGSLKEIQASELVPFISSMTPKPQTLGLSIYSDSNIHIDRVLAEIKKLLGSEHKIRYILPSEGTILSSIVIKKQKCQDIVLVFDKNNSNWIIGKVLEVQDANTWAKRDFGRPYADSKAGMLPPKVARMMVNLSWQSEVGSSQKARILLDPFCGMGTVLAEALLLGWQVIGSDYSQTSIEKADKNLDWLTSIFQFINKLKKKLLVSDATRISQHFEKSSIDAIVTEPFLGAPFEFKNNKLYQKNELVTVEKIKNTIKGLEKLYIGAMRDWSDVLKSQGKVVIAFPEIYFEGRKFTVKKVIDRCEILDYTLAQGPYEYGRLQAIVKRQIYVFQKLNTKFLIHNSKLSYGSY